MNAKASALQSGHSAMKGEDSASGHVEGQGRRHVRSVSSTGRGLIDKSVAICVVRDCVGAFAKWQLRALVAASLTNARRLVCAHLTWTAARRKTSSWPSGQESDGKVAAVRRWYPQGAQGQDAKHQPRGAERGVGNLASGGLGKNTGGSRPRTHASCLFCGCAKP